MADGFSSPVDLGMPATPDSTLPDDLYAQFQSIYNALHIMQDKLGQATGLSVLDPQNFINTLAPTNDQSLIIQRMLAVTCVVGVAVSSNQFVNFYDNAGVENIRPADASAMANYAHGFVSQAYGVGQKAVIFMFMGYIPAVGLTRGATYFLSPSSPGGITATAPVTPGMIRQPVGVAISTTELAMRLGDPVQL